MFVGRTGAAHAFQIQYPVEHFFVISAIVYALILVCTLIGTYLPAREVSRVDPVDALRDE